MKALRSKVAAAVSSGLLAFASQQAGAVPSLQLDILGGTYDSTPDVETVMTSSTSFSLYAYGLTSDFSTGDNFYLAMALVPQTSSPASIGSFTFTVGATTTSVNVTSDMTYGVPPLETILGGAGFDAGDLGKHGIYETYFYQHMFSFSGAQSGIYNTQDDAGSGPQSGTGMYYEKFDFNLSGIPQGYGLHFDLYSSALVEKCNNNGCTSTGDIDVTQFAPFSHDAQAMPIPEPETYAMLLAGLGLMGFVARRRKAAIAAALS